MEAGSVGLIMENRPTNLPAKTAGEQLKHKLEYQRMVSAAKKKGEYSALCYSLGNSRTYTHKKKKIRKC